MKITLRVLGDSFTKEDFLDKIFPNPWDALAVFIAFVILLLIVFYFAYKPVKALIKKRGDYVEGKIKEADEKVSKANTLLDETLLEVLNSKVEAREIVSDAKKQAEIERKNILEKAREEKAAEVIKAKEEIAQEIEASKDEIHREIVSVAIDVSSKVLEREIKEQDNKKLIDNFIDDLKEGK